MARPRSEFLSSLGKLFSIFKKVADKVLELKGNDELITNIDSYESVALDVAQVLTGDALAVKVNMRQWDEQYGYANIGKYGAVIAIFKKGDDGSKVVRVGDSVEFLLDPGPLSANGGTVLEIVLNRESEPRLVLEQGPGCRAEVRYEEVRPLASRRLVPPWGD